MKVQVIESVSWVQGACWCFKGYGRCFKIRIRDINVSSLVSLDFSFYERFFLLVFFIEIVEI